LRAGKLSEAAADFADALRHFVAVGSRANIAWLLEFIAWLASAAGAHREAARLMGAAEGLRELTGLSLNPRYRRDHEAASSAGQAALGDDAFLGAWAEGKALPLKTAVAEATALAESLALTGSGEMTSRANPRTPSVSSGLDVI
jgi:hypothetical protein